MARTIKVPAWKFTIPRLPKHDPDTPDVFEEMTLQEHLIELRDRIMKICIAIGLSFIIGFILQDPLIEQLREKAKAEGGFQVLGPTDGLMLSFKVALYIAIAIAFPVILYQIIAFLAPGLTRREKRFVFMSLPFVSILFLSGVAYGYFVAAPRALDFLSNWNSDSLSWDITGEETLSFFLTLMIGLGFAFQLPVVMFVLAKLGVFTPRMMRKNRKYAVIIMMIAAAIITPSTDPFNLAVVFFPLWALYELGIILASIFARTTLRSDIGGDDDGDLELPAGSSAASV